MLHVVILVGHITGFIVIRYTSEAIYGAFLLWPVGYISYIYKCLITVRQLGKVLQALPAKYYLGPTRLLV